MSQYFVLLCIIECLAAKKRLCRGDMTRWGLIITPLYLHRVSHRHIDTRHADTSDTRTLNTQTHGDTDIRHQTHIYIRHQTNRPTYCLHTDTRHTDRLTHGNQTYRHMDIRTLDKQTKDTRTPDTQTNVHTDARTHRHTDTKQIF